MSWAKVRDDYLKPLGVIAAAFIPGFGAYAVMAASTMYAIDSSRRQARASRRAYENSLSDRTVTIRAADAPRKIIYGRAKVGGVVVYAKGATDTSPRFMIVLALAGHECDGLEAVYAGGQHTPLDAFGNANGPGRYYTESEVGVVQTITPDASDRIYLGADAVLLNAVETDTSLGYDQVHSIAFSQIGAGVYQFTDRQFDTPPTITFKTTSRKSYLSVRFYRGTPDQAADDTLIQASGGVWTANHRLRGVCYAIIDIDPDPEVWAEGLPEFEFVVRGHRVLTGGGSTEWSYSPAYCSRHYLRTYAKWPAAVIDDDAVLDAATSCAEPVDRDGVNQQERYTCDGVLSTEADFRTNVATILGSMVGTLSFDGGKAIIRAGAYTEPTVTLTDDDLVGPSNVQGFQSAESTFNAVGGRFFDGDVVAGQNVKSWQFVSFPAYRSPLYAAQDAGFIVQQDIDLPMTLDTYRAQRIARLHLHRGRQALRHFGGWKFSAIGASTGKTVYLKLKRYGWDTLNGGLGKIFRVDEAGIDFEAGRIATVMQEEAEAIYDEDYTELDGRDPAPNTDFPTYRDIAPIVGLQVLTGGNFVETLSDGTRWPYARVTWTQVADPSVLGSGRIDLQWIVNGSTEWASAPALDPYSTAYHIAGVAAGDVLQVRIRARNSIAQAPWVYSTVTVDTTSGGGASNALIGSGVNAVTNASLRSALAPFKYYDIAANATVTTDGGSPGGGSSDITIYLGGGASRPNDRPVPFGSIVWEETTYSAEQKGWIYNDDAFPVIPGDIWEVQVWAYLLRVAPFDPGLFYYDASGTGIGTSWDDGSKVLGGGFPLASYTGLNGTSLLSQFQRMWAFCEIPAGAVQARWAFKVYPSPTYFASGSSAKAVLTMPFAARSNFPSMQRVLAEGGPQRLSNWNGS